jgi:hypothetical protein
MIVCSIRSLRSRYCTVAEYDASFDRATPSKIRSKFERLNTTLEAMLVGTFDPKHLSFQIVRAEQAAEVSKSGSSPWRLPDKLKGRHPCNDKG